MEILRPVRVFLSHALDRPHAAQRRALWWRGARWEEEREEKGGTKMKDKRKRARDEADQEEDKGDEEQQQEQQQEEEEEEEEDVIEEEEDSEDGEDKEEDSDDDDDEEDDEEDEEDEPFRGIAESAAIAPSPSSAAQNLPSTSSAPFVFVLQRASLQVAKLGKNRNSSSGGSGLTVLNCDDHRRYLMRHKKDPAQYRPDIIHQALLALLDSPLNKAGKIKVPKHNINALLLSLHV